MCLSLYAEDKEKQEGGSPCYLGDATFLVQRVGTAEYNKQIQKITRQEYGLAPKDIDNGLILATWLCEHGVTNWEGVYNVDDTPLAYSKKHARMVFLNPAFHLSLNALLINHGADYANYLHDALEEDIEAAKKS